MPFGQVPVKTLNGEAREINYKEKSSWVVLRPKYRSRKNLSTKLNLTEDGVFNGNLMISKNGYSAIEQREKISLKNEESYLEDFEAKYLDVEVEDYTVKNLEKLDQTLHEIFKVRIEMDEELGNKLRLNPFLFDRVSKNPFKLKERNYPVDFAYPRIKNYYLKLVIPENYTIISLPKNKAISLPNKGSKFTLNVSKRENIINISSRIQITKSMFSSEEYFALKEFYKQIILSENSNIVLEKK